MSIEEDARVFGQHFQGGWQLGLLVARNVHKRAGAGRPSKSEPVRNKVSCAEFAKIAGISDRTVQLVYDTWRLAAEEGHCTPPEQLLTGMDDPKLSGIDVGDQEHREMWRKFYRQTRERRVGNANARTGSGRCKGKASSSHSQADERTESAENESPSAESDSSWPDGSEGKASSDPTAHPLYGLLLGINHLSDELKRGGPAASIRSAAEKAATAKHRAALRRVTGAL